MKILIIGGTGLISTPLVQELVSRGEAVTLYNRGKTPPPVGVAQIVGDRTTHACFEAQMQAAGHFDCVIDMVGYAPADGASVVRAFGGRVQHLVFCSTVDVHQKLASHYPVHETEPYGPLNEYARGKVAIEGTLMQASESGAFALTILRPAHTYNDRGALIHALGGALWIDRLRRGLPVIVHGDGTSLWSQAHAHDVAHAFAQAAGNRHAWGNSYTVTNEQCLSWNDLFVIAAREMNAPPPHLVHIPVDVLQRWVPEWTGSLADNFFGHNLFDIRAAKADLDYHTTIDYAKGAQRFFEALDWSRIEEAHSNPRFEALLERWNRVVDLEPLP